MKSFKDLDANRSVKTWQAGHIFDDNKEIIPSGVLLAFNKGNKSMKALVDMTDVKTQVMSDKQLQATLKDLEDSNSRINELQNENASLKADNNLLKEEIKSLKIAAINQESVIIPQGASAKENSKKEDTSQPAAFKCDICGRDDFKRQQDVDSHKTKLHPGK
jgi:regulator of replication initiation timing